jgi:hypothetical protein
MIEPLNMQSRTLLFYGICIPLRIVIAYLAYIATTSKNPRWKLYALPLALTGLVFAYLYITNGRLHAPEGGGQTWWAQFRLIHALLYIAAAIYVIQGDNKAWVPLVIDVFTGAFLKMINTYEQM